MTVLDLIKILQTHDPAATVVVPTYNDRADVANALGLQIGGVRELKLRAIHHVKASRFAPAHGVQHYEIEDDGEINGVEIGGFVALTVNQPARLC